jgi:hypothetical protein
LHTGPAPLSPRANLVDLIRKLESHLDAKADGLPEELFLFLSRLTPLINVDLLIQDDDARTSLRHFHGMTWGQMVDTERRGSWLSRIPFPEKG